MHMAEMVSLVQSAWPTKYVSIIKGKHEPVQLQPRLLSSASHSRSPSLFRRVLAWQVASARQHSSPPASREAALRAEAMASQTLPLPDLAS
mmetsp:Transcript_121032/g.196909  ORF Transcript_121032/g.196909 Transcript_121032/m.196909 type:complete len:91 (-) Transcript_121032:737-1009(-)